MSCDGEHGRMLVFPSDFGEAGVPPYQPGEGIYTSQMTLLVDSMEVENVQEIIRDTFCALQIPFHEDTYKFKVNAAAYFTSGFARFYIRTWRSRRSENTYAVELMRERGDRILVARVFENLSAALRGEPGSSPEELRASFSVDMFDWKPVQLPPEILAKLPVSGPEEVSEGIAAMISMVKSRYDDVAVNGCASVAKLAAASSRTRENMAQSVDLIHALHCVAHGHDGLSLLSMDTRTNAALALSEILQLLPGQRHFLHLATVFPEESSPPVVILAHATAIEADYEITYFRHYCVAALASVCAATAEDSSPMPHPQLLLYFGHIWTALDSAKASAFEHTAALAQKGLETLDGIRKYCLL